MTSGNGARCIVVGGGPAGMMTSFLLARAGVEVAVLEKHADFNRDFRGDTIHPSTLELMHELGLLEEFLKLPHQELREIRGVFNGHQVPIADFARLRTRCKFIAFMPQWDFLNFFASHAKRFPTFALHICSTKWSISSSITCLVGVRVALGQLLSHGIHPETRTGAVNYGFSDSGVRSPESFSRGIALETRKPG